MKARINYSAKCSTCGRKYADHSEDDLIECVQNYQKDYDGTLASILRVLAKDGLARKWGQPGQNKKEWAIWPVSGDPPLVSTVPTTDFAIFFLTSQKAPTSKKDKEDKNAKKETKPLYTEE
jgi:hypothetical protein